ncbi:MAG: hypothetical protein AAF990_24815 [Bacteroidota bacterium]
MKVFHSLAIAILVCLFSACTMLKLTPSKKVVSIKFDETSTNESYRFIHQDTVNSPELITLLSLYDLDKIAEGEGGEMDKILQLLQWTNSRWQHSGSNKPSKSNTLTILKEAESGKKFRCVEYGIVLKSVLASNDFKARTLSLKTKDVEKVRLGAGHVLTEAWSNAYNKWFMLDAQFNIVPVQESVPLNAVELQKAIIENADFQLVDSKGEVSPKRRKKYLNFVSHYLYYFDYKFDQREIAYDSLFKVNDHAVLMLVPIGAKSPSVFQRKYEMDFVEYTHSLNDFYRRPE